MIGKTFQPSPFDYLEIQDRLEEIESEDPFEILFYGSRERGDHEEDSDFNFYLLASTQDQMRPGFVQKVTSTLKILEKFATVNLVAGDKETFRIRLNLFEPSVIHMLEKGTVFFGDHIFHKFQKIWQSLQNEPIPKQKLIPFLNRRINFYRSLKARNEKDNAIRQERIYSLSIQVWALKHIQDISIQELIALDIPKECDMMVPVLYKNEFDPEIKELLLSRRDWQDKKRYAQTNHDYKLKESYLPGVLESTQSK
jgi:predicted nucleotidyltransferase